MSEKMKISELIKKLQQAQRSYGDLPITTYGGFVRYVTLTPAKDGVVYPLEPGTQDEISVEINT